MRENIPTWQWSARAWNSRTDKEFIKITSFTTTSCNSDGAAPELNHCKFSKRSRTLQWYSIEISRFDEHVADRYGLVDPTLMAYCYNNSGSTNWVVLQSTLLGEVIGSSRISRVFRWSADYIHSGRYFFARLLEELIILNLDYNIIRPLWSRLPPPSHLCRVRQNDPQCQRRVVLRLHLSAASRWEADVTTLHRGWFESKFLVRNSSDQLQKWSCEVWSCLDETSRPLFEEKPFAEVDGSWDCCDRRLIGDQLSNWVNWATWRDPIASPISISLTWTLLWDPTSLQ